VGAENLRDQAIFVNYAPGAIAPLDPELIPIRDAVGRLPQRRCLLQGAVRPMGVIEVLVLAPHDHQVPLIPHQGPTGAGGMPAFFRICQTVDGATVMPSPANSPWMRR
jgi:hypothetical protein